MSKFLVAGNWKMNGTVQSCRELATAIRKNLKVRSNLSLACEFVVAPPYPYLLTVFEQLDAAGISLGAQDCALKDNGAHTGDVSAAMLADCGIKYVILGHSERRQDHSEKSSVVRAKIQKVLESSLKPIICVGETLEEREASREFDVVKKQLLDSLPVTPLSNLVIAYEPVWAIGTGKTASVEDVEAMHDFIFSVLQEHIDKADDIRILYGGSVKPENAGELAGIKNVRGFLIGGASLRADSFVDIASQAYEAASNK